MRLSQGQLTVLETCPRKFQYTYLEQLMSPPPPAQQEKLDWGSRFHQLMQQQELGLPLPSAAMADRQMEACRTALMQAAPELFQPGRPPLRQSEHRRTLEFGDHLLTVIYDLLMLGSDRATIIDWKTYPQPQNHQWLQNHWQTRLYPFVLTETSHYRPDQIAMVYWFVQASDESQQVKPQALSFAYSEALHQHTRQRLTCLLAQLDRYLLDYDQGQLFPKVSLEQGVCANCPFAVRCQRLRSLDADSDALVTDINAIEEVAL